MTQLEHDADIPLNEIRESDENGRIEYHDARQKELIQSIKGHRLEERLLVRPFEDGGYELVDGHRRFRALQALDWTTAPCRVRSMTRDEARLYRVATIFQKDNGTPYEQARYLAMCMRNEGMTRTKLSQMTGIKPGTLKARLEILDFPEDVARRIGKAGFGMEHARLLAQLANRPEALAKALALVDAKDPDSHQTVQDLYAEVSKTLLKAGMARDPQHTKHWELRRELPTFEDQASELEHVAMKTPHGKEILVLDVEGFDNLVAKAEGTIKRRREKEAKAKAVKEAAPEDPAEKERLLREAHERKVREAAHGWQQQNIRDATQARLRDLKEVSRLDLGIVVLNLLEVGIDSDDVAALAESAGIPAERIEGFLEWNDDGDWRDQPLIRDSTPDQLVRLIVAVYLNVSMFQSWTWSHVQEHWSGKTEEAWSTAATAAATDLLKNEAPEAQASPQAAPEVLKTEAPEEAAPEAAVQEAAP